MVMDGTRVRVAANAGGERVKGIEPSYAAWEAAVLPLNYTRRVEMKSVRWMCGSQVWNS